MNMPAALTFVTRPSALARWQTNHVIDLLQRAWPGLSCRSEVIVTRGDRTLDKPLPEIGGKGLFTLELEDALRAGRVDVAVHSLKDLPTEDAPDLRIGAVPIRADARDAWICPAGHTLETLPVGAVVGTSSTRRRAQVLACRSDLVVRPIRGNVDTRLRKVLQGQFDAIVLAAAGLARLGLQRHITAILPCEVMVPAPGQGALAVQCRADDGRTLEILARIEDQPTRKAVTAERAFLESLGGGCSLPVGAYAVTEGGRVALQGAVISPGGEETIETTGRGVDPLLLGRALAKEVLERGAARLLEGVA